MGGEGSSSPPPPLGHPRSRRGCRVNPGLCPAPLAHLRTLHRPPAGGKFCGSQSLTPASPQQQHQLRAAARAGPRLTHLPTGWGRWLLASGRRGSGACISGSGGLCCSARESASSRVGRRRGRGGTGRRGGARPAGSNAEARTLGARRRELVDRPPPGLPRASPHERRQLASPAAEPAVWVSAATGSRARPEAGNYRWRDAVQMPASSSARLAPRSAPLRSGGGRGAPRPGSAVWTAAAASSSPPRPRSWSLGTSAAPGCCSLRCLRTAPAAAWWPRLGLLRARPPQASAHCDASQEPALCCPGGWKLGGGTWENLTSPRAASLTAVPSGPPLFVGSKALRVELELERLLKL